MFNAFPFHDSERGTQTDPTSAYDHTSADTGSGAIAATTAPIAPAVYYTMDPDRAQIIENCKILFPASTPSIVTRSSDTTLQALVINTSRSHFLPIDSAGVEASGLLLSHTVKKSSGGNVIRGLLQKSQSLLNTRLREHSSRSLAAEEEVSRILHSEAWANYPDSVKSKAGGIILRRLWDEMVEAEKAKEKREIEECLKAFEEERGRTRKQEDKETARAQHTEKERMLERQRKLEDELRRCQRDYVQRFGDRGRAREISALLGEDAPVSPTSSGLDRRNAVNAHHDRDHGSGVGHGHGGAISVSTHANGLGGGGGGGSNELSLMSPRQYAFESISRSSSPRPPLSIAGELQLMRVGTGSISGSSSGVQTPPCAAYSPTGQARGVTLRD